MMKEPNPFDEVKQSIRAFDSVFYYFTNEKLITSFSEKVPTAGVYLNKEDTDDLVRIEVHFNPDFWSNLNYNEKVFLFIHEALHMVFNHGKRGHELKNGKANQQLVNIAQDICINHIIEDQFLKAIPRSSMPVIQQGCFIDTIFGEHASSIEKGRSFEYYYDKYVELFGNVDEDDEFTMSSIDSHDGMGGEDIDESLQEELEDIIEESEVLSADEINGTEEANKSDNSDTSRYGEEQSIGNSSGGGNGNIVTNMSLEQLFNFVIKDAFVEKKTVTKNRTWYGYDRRTTPLTQTMSEDLILPVVNRKVEKEKKVHRVCVYPDVSGSCADYTEKLISLILNMDSEKFHFEIYPWADFVGNIRYYRDDFEWVGTGGGTNIHQVLRDHRNRTQGHFDAYFVLTDGMYDTIRDRKTEDAHKWYFFFTPNHNKQYLKGSTYYVFDRL